MVEEFPIEIITIACDSEQRLITMASGTIHSRLRSLLTTTINLLCKTGKSMFGWQISVKIAVLKNWYPHGLGKFHASVGLHGGKDCCAEKLVPSQARNDSVSGMGLVRF